MKISDEVLKGWAFYEVRVDNPDLTFERDYSDVPAMAEELLAARKVVEAANIALSEGSVTDYYGNATKLRDALANYDKATGENHETE